MSTITMEFDVRDWAEISHALSTHAAELISAEARRSGGRSVSHTRILQTQTIQDEIDKALRERQRRPEVIH